MPYPYYPQYQPYQQQNGQFQQPTQQTIQSTGFISVPNEEMARSYPVAPGNSVSFRNENAPYVYTKTMGFSQFDQPIFKKYKLIEEETESAQSISCNMDVQAEIHKLWDEVNVLKKTMGENDGV